tara:strand:- start:6992 stop:7414 length:423 start_codon:yes stop_codon:yes gene_type:complete
LAPAISAKRHFIGLAGCEFFKIEHPSVASLATDLAGDAMKGRDIDHAATETAQRKPFAVDTHSFAQQVDAQHGLFATRQRNGALFECAFCVASDARSDATLARRTTLAKHTFARVGRDIEHLDLHMFHFFFERNGASKCR